MRSHYFGWTKQKCDWTYKNKAKQTTQQQKRYQITILPFKKRVCATKVTWSRSQVGINISNTSILLTKRKVKMAGYYPSSLFAFSWTQGKSRSIKTQKENKANISSHLDPTSLVNEGFIIGRKEHWKKKMIFVVVYFWAPKRKPVICKSDMLCFSFLIF